MPNDDNQLKWDNMLEWRGEVSSTIHYLERALEKQERALSKLEEVFSRWPRESDKNNAEILAMLQTTISQARADLRSEITAAKKTINELENFTISAEEHFATKKDLDENNKALNDRIDIVQNKIHGQTLKIATAIIGILSAYEILQRVGLL